MEIYVDKTWHMGTNNDSTTISKPPFLRKMLLLKGEEHVKCWLIGEDPGLIIQIPKTTWTLSLSESPA
jgi:hypothetical protein